MKNLIKVGLTDCAGSLLPILTWYILGILKDNRYANVFMLTYAFQFAWLLVFRICVAGNVKYEKKLNEMTHSISLTSSFIGLLILSSIVAVIWTNIDNVMTFYGVTDVEYKYFSLFGLVLLVLDYIEYILKYLLQFSNDNRRAAVTCYSYYILRILFVIVLAVSGVSNNVLMIGTVVFCIAMLIVLIMYNHKLFSGVRFKFKIIESIKMAYSSIASNGAMFLIYSFGMCTLEGSEIFLSAYNAMTMATDTQWDILYSSIDTNTSIIVLDGEYEDKKHVMSSNAITYSLLLLATSAIALLIICETLNVNKMFAFVLLLLECAQFPAYALKYVYQAWVECVCPNKLMFILTVSVYLVRIFTLFIVNNEYALSISVAVSAVYGNAMYFIFYMYMRKKYAARQIDCI